MSKVSIQHINRIEKSSTAKISSHSEQQSASAHAQNVFERPGSRDPSSANETLSFPCFFAGAFLRDGLTAMFSKAALRDVTQP